jgi:hypothetical protein
MALDTTIARGWPGTAPRRDAAGALNADRDPSRSGRTEKVERFGIGREPDLRSGDAPGEVVGGDVDATPGARLSGLVGGVVVRRPLQPDVGRESKGWNTVIGRSISFE